MNSILLATAMLVYLSMSVVFVTLTNAFVLRSSSMFRARISQSIRMGSDLPNTIPLEMEGKLDPTRSWDVTFIFNGEEKTVKVPEATSILKSGNTIFNGDVPYSCLNGVCITCACQILKGRENVKSAVQGLGDPQIQAGFACACQSFPTGPGIVVKLGAYDECYESQYGQFEKSYGDLKYGNKQEEEKKKEKKGFFGF